MIVGAISFAMGKLAYSHITYSLESNSLTFSQGLFNIQTQVVPFQKVRGSLYSQGVLQRAFGLGTLTFDLGEGSATFSNVDEQSAQAILASLQK